MNATMANFAAVAKNEAFGASRAADKLRKDLAATKRMLGTGVDTEYGQRCVADAADQLARAETQVVIWEARAKLAEEEGLLLLDEPSMMDRDWMSEYQDLITEARLANRTRWTDPDSAGWA